jgi:Helix-turn-helix domain
MANDWRFAMAAAIPLRADYDANRLRQLAKHSDDADQTRRQLALAVICDGGSRGEAGELAGVGPQTVRDWVLRFNAEGPSTCPQRRADCRALEAWRERQSVWATCWTAGGPTRCAGEIARPKLLGGMGVDD